MLAFSWVLGALAVIVVAVVRDMRRRGNPAAPHWSGHGPPFMVTVALSLVIQAVAGAFTGDSDWGFTLLMAGVNGLVGTAVVFLLALRDRAAMAGARAVQLVGVTVGVAGGLAAGAGAWVFG
ncbi:hypothetical protein ACFXAZ_38320 [Streptomyces sp. NPDC059477]|uniref:hypothetical protein n=1 Tax=Streptomyces sp. NPDC059477 TaxID=3346847 RepID=UPI0036A95DB1